MRCCRYYGAKRSLFEYLLRPQHRQETDAAERLQWVVSECDKGGVVTARRLLKGTISFDQAHMVNSISTPYSP
jgi:hypothetical protein